jgi:hypothetical protein
MLTICAAFLAAVATVSSPDPEEVFRNPPRSAMTGAWWHWMGSSISKEGIVKDLDWFKRSGIGSVTIFAIADICVPWAAEIKDPPGGKIIGFSEKWWEFVRFACDEAEKRGIEVGLHNCPGYTSTGGPWITSDLAMRQLVFNVTNASEQISLRAVAHFPVENADNGKFEIPQIAARHTDIKEIAVVDGVRVQHIPMGAFTQPNQWDVFGLECDKMNPRAVEFHLDHVIGEMKKYLGRHIGKTFKFVLLDSYEAGRPTWSENFREEFKIRRGYDPLPYLPILGGFKCSVADEKGEKKFRADYERTRKDLFRDVLFKIMREKLSSVGLEFACEPYEGPFDSQECARHVDRLMTEFWFDPKVPSSVPEPLGWDNWVGPSGKRHNVIEAEAFTSGPPLCMWTETPLLLKSAADLHFSRGINRMILHTCPLQPWGDDVKPGKTMGRWGTHFGRNQTWAESGKGFFEYLNRSQALLQWGEPSDEKVCFVDSSPNDAALSALCRASDDKRVIFVVNHSDKAVASSLKISLRGKLAEWFDPVRGSVEILPVRSGAVCLNLAPRGSGFVVLRKSAEGATASLSTRAASGDEYLVSSSWEVVFGKKRVVMDRLYDWTSSEDCDIKYFSGTARYRTCFKYSGKTALYLSLGDCNGQIAAVTLNGRHLGTLWCQPYEISLKAGDVKKGDNVLEIEFTNVWANSLIGDERHESDCEFVEAPYPGGEYLRRFPKWFDGSLKSRPSKGRKCFTDWNYFKKDSKLIPSGLLGPVKITH